MKLFGADPKELQEVYRKLYATEMELGILRHDTDSMKTENGLLRSMIKALEADSAELKKAALEAKARVRQLSQAPDPFADFPPEVKALIDFSRMGLKEP
jgi:hypothetical protein